MTFEQGRNELNIDEELLSNFVTKNKEVPEEALIDMKIALITLKYTQSNSVCYVKGGQAIVINMEGMELSTAQRIIDFIAGACYSLDGSLQAISGNIFIAAPADIYVSGDLREELLNDAFMSPELSKY